MEIDGLDFPIRNEQELGTYLDTIVAHHSGFRLDFQLFRELLAKVQNKTIPDLKQYPADAWVAPGYSDQMVTGVYMLARSLGCQYGKSFGHYLDLENKEKSPVGIPFNYVSWKIWNKRIYRAMEYFIRYTFAFNTAFKMFPLLKLMMVTGSLNASEVDQRWRETINREWRLLEQAKNELIQYLAHQDGKSMEDYEAELIEAEISEFTLMYDNLVWKESGDTGVMFLEDATGRPVILEFSSEAVPDEPSTVHAKGVERAKKQMDKMASDRKLRQDD
ncbi:MAG: hypothetical protein ACXABY_11720 [Candidatus Thorarchaeota archaeon]